MRYELGLSLKKIPRGGDLLFYTGCGVAVF